MKKRKEISESSEEYFSSEEYDSSEYYSYDSYGESEIPVEYDCGKSAAANEIREAIIFHLQTISSSSG